ncbi:Rhodanese-like domain protein [Crateriforma conspicua]|uniref:Rhodanese-like domain protein n=1 Tax=Crateriforma conspicua TaxID=2527996 RepID=A0A5C5Y420_9PLAN|nr:Rhodanese-like domain protein [Crateriforma conspicua]
MQKSNLHPARAPLATWSRLLIGLIVIAGPGCFTLDAADSYCGIQAAAAFGQLVGQPIDASDHASVQYVVSRQGSTAKQLCDLLGEYGLDAEGYAGLSLLDLKVSGTPWLANVRKRSDSREYDHWICVYFENETLMVIDGHKKAREMSITRFLASWNGFAITQSSAMKLPTVARVLFYVSLIFPCLWVPQQLNRTSFLAYALPVLWIIGLTLVVQTKPSQITKASSLALAPWNHFPQSAATERELASAISRSDVQLVDARLTSDFAAGSVPTAINLPVDLSMAELDQRAGRLDPRLPTIVFCQSRQCNFDDSVAARLVAIGFEDVRTCQVGWREYSEARKPNSACDTNE